MILTFEFDNADEAGEMEYAFRDAWGHKFNTKWDGGVEVYVEVDDPRDENTPVLFFDKDYTEKRDGSLMESRRVRGRLVEEEEKLRYTDSELAKVTFTRSRPENQRMGMKYRYWGAEYVDGEMGAVDHRIQKVVEKMCERIQVFGQNEFLDLFDAINGAIQSNFSVGSVPEFGWLMRNTDRKDVDKKGNPLPAYSKMIEVLHGDKLRSVFYFVPDKDFREREELEESASKWFIAVDGKEGGKLFDTLSSAKRTAEKMWERGEDGTIEIRKADDDGFCMRLKAVGNRIKFVEC